MRQWVPASNDAEVGLALRYAYERNVVVVAAAGNLQQQGLCGNQNPVPDPNLPLARDWESVQTIVSPAWFSDYVLTVGALSSSGQPAEFSLHGPWVAVAAPGERIVSLDPNGPGLINAWQDQRGLVPINGTSFAAPLVSGLVALVRSRFPGLSAGQVIELIKRTARTGGVGPQCHDRLRRHRPDRGLELSIAAVAECAQSRRWPADRGSTTATI